MLAFIGSRIVCAMHNTGDFVLFCFRAIVALFHPPFYTKNWLEQLFKVGFLSIPVIGLTAIFSGAVLALQSYSGFSRFNAESSIATVVVLSITRELAPVLSGLMVSARVGSSLAAEIGTMKVTEQINALKMLSVSPLGYLIAPRILAGVVCMPILVLIADVIGIFGGYLVSVNVLKFSPGVYISNTMQYLTFPDVMGGVIKALVFGFVITSISCYNGYKAEGGAEGVGRVTINSVVSSAIAIFFSITLLLLFYFSLLSEIF